MDLTHYGEDILRKKAEPVEKVDESLQQLIRDMFETMYEEEGIGLAANQVGVDKAIATIDISHTEEGVPPFVLINPEIIEHEGEEAMEEGCLSIPGVHEEVKRAGRIVVRYMTRENEVIEREATGLLARVIQHETDHLNGTFFVDRISPIKRRILQRKLNTIARDGFQAEAD